MTMSFEAHVDLHLRLGGGGGDPKDGLCLMEFVDLLSGAERVTDRPRTACPVLTELAINLNDFAPSDQERDGLKPFAPRLIGTNDPEMAWPRADYIVRQAAARVVAPIDALGARRALRSLRRKNIDHHVAWLVVSNFMTEAEECVRRARANGTADEFEPRWRAMREILSEVLLLEAPREAEPLRLAA